MSDSYSGLRLPSNFFERLTEKQPGMIHDLIDVDGDWVLGSKIQQRMHNDYGIDIGEDGNPTAGVPG